MSVNFNKEFNFTIPLLKNYKKNDDGTVMLYGSISGTNVDRDDERMSETCLDKMVAAFNSGFINFFGNHEHNWENILGKFVAAKKDMSHPDHKVDVEIRTLNVQKKPKVQELLDTLDSGGNVGLSVGGKYLDFKTDYDEELEKDITDIKDIEVFEGSAVGIASNELGSIAGQLHKSLRKALNKDVFKPGLEEGDDNWRWRVQDPAKFDSDTFRTIDITDGVQAVIGKYKNANEKDDTTHVQTVIFSKERFKTREQVTKWKKKHEELWQKSFTIDMLKKLRVDIMSEEKIVSKSVESLMGELKTKELNKDELIKRLGAIEKAAKQMEEEDEDEEKKKKKQMEEEERRREEEEEKKRKEKEEEEEKKRKEKEEEEEKKKAAFVDMQKKLETLEKEVQKKPFRKLDLIIDGKSVKSEGEEEAPFTFGKAFQRTH